jgi:Ca2+-binding RTX toxin-like protein
VDPAAGFLGMPYNGVAVSLEDGEGFWGEALGDTYEEVENIIGSAYDDLLIRSSIANTISGKAGRDVIDGGGGGDTLDGGEGIDAVSYYGSNAGVKVDLSNNTASGAGPPATASGTSKISQAPNSATVSSGRPSTIGS